MIKKDNLKNYLKLLDYIYINKNNEVNNKILEGIRLSILESSNIRNVEFIQHHFPNQFFNNDHDHALIEINDYEMNIIARLMDDMITLINDGTPKDYLILIFPLNKLFKLLLEGKSFSDWIKNNYLAIYRLYSEGFLLEEENNYINDFNPSLTVNMRYISCLCDYRHYGSFLEHCSYFYYRFTNKVYGIVNKFGQGGWALTYTLAGRNEEYNKYNDLKSTIFYNNQEMKMNQLKAISCYVDNDPLEFTKREFKHKNLLYFFNKAKKSNPNFKADLNEIIKFFNLENFTDRKINQLGTRYFNATIAIGYIQGKKLFCYPWISDVLFYEKKILGFSQFLKERGCTVLIPTDDMNNIKYLVDEIVDMQNDSFVYYYKNPKIYPNVSDIKELDDQYLQIRFDNGFLKKLNKQVLIKRTELLLKENSVKDIQINTDGHGIVWNNDKCLYLSPSELWNACDEI